jgi:hypothetical protein
MLTAFPVCILYASAYSSERPVWGEADPAKRDSHCITSRVEATGPLNKESTAGATNDWLPIYGNVRITCSKVQQWGVGYCTVPLLNLIGPLTQQRNESMAADAQYAR